MDDLDLASEVTSLWIAHGRMSVIDTHARLGGEERVDLSSVKKACSKAQKGGDVERARDAHLTDGAKRHAAEAAMARFEKSARLRRPVSRKTAPTRRYEEANI